MYTCQLDPTLERVTAGSMRFPLGVYPVEPISPIQGYAVEFEPADGAEDGSDLEEWPDRYVYDIMVSIERLPLLIVQLLSLMPSRVYPILDFIGHDEFREIDPYISYERIGTDQIIDATRQFRGFFYEDGMCGFGAMCEEPFFYLFVDEHKILTVRVEPTLKPRVDKLLEAMDLPETTDLAGVDTVAHEHRSVLVVPAEPSNVLSAEEIVGFLRQEWRLTLNIDPESNVDDEGNELGVTGWRTVFRCVSGEDELPRYGESFLWAGNLLEAEDMALKAAESLMGDLGAGEWRDVAVLALDRVSDERLGELLKGRRADVSVELREKRPRVIEAHWLDATS